MVVTSEDKNKIRIIFIGTPKFALPSLEALINDEQFDIIAVIAQPDKKVGRKQIVTSPVIKVLAEKNNIPVLQPQKISSSPWRDEILKLRPDIIVVAAYAQIIPRSILDIPAFGCINVHGSLLPRWRGASCIQAAIMNGDKKTGVTIIKMDAGLDTGPILAQTAVDILPTDTADSLYGKLAKLGAEMLIPTLKDYIAGKITPQPQDNSLPSYAGMLKKEDGKIDWLKTAVEIERFVRAMNPWPNAFASLKIKNKISKIKIIGVEYKILKSNNRRIGEAFLHNNKLAVQCGKDALIIKKLQLEGKKETPVEEFLRGHSWIIGSVFVG